MDSRFKHGDQVVVNLGAAGIIIGEIYAVNFTHSKVSYDIDTIPFPGETDTRVRLSNIHSFFVERPLDRFKMKSNVGLISNDN